METKERKTADLRMVLRAPGVLGEEEGEVLHPLLRRQQFIVVGAGHNRNESKRQLLRVAADTRTGTTPMTLNKKV